MIYKGEDIIVNEISSDTIFRLSPNNGLTPILTRTPSVSQSDPLTILMVTLETDRYLFMTAIKKEYDEKTKSGFPPTYLMADKNTNEIVEYSLYNEDYINEDFVFRGDANATMKAENKSFIRIQTHRLKEALENNYVKNDLKEIASSLQEDDNNVIMFLKFKN